MHFTMNARDAAVTLQHNSRVMIETRRTTFKETRDDNHMVFLSQSTEELSRGSGNRFRQIKGVNRFDLTEIRRVVKFLQDNQLCTASGSIGNSRS